MTPAVRDVPTPGDPRSATAPPLVSGYAEFAVHPALSDHVVCTWVDAPHALRQPVLPDACIDLVWDGTALVIAGPDTSAQTVAADDTFVGIRFRPGAAPRFLGVAAHELLDTRLELRALWGRAADDLAEQLSGHEDAAARTLLERALLRRLDDVRPGDGLIDEVLYELSRSALDGEPTTVLSRLVGQVGASERTLRRRCTDALGYGPKTLDRILRFRRALRLMRGGLPPADVARLAGYADQAHLTNECRRLARATPSALARLPRLALAANGCD